MCVVMHYVLFQYFIRPFKDKGGTLSCLESFFREVRWLCRQREAQQTLVLVVVNLVATLLLVSWCHATHSMGQCAAGSQPTPPLSVCYIIFMNCRINANLILCPLTNAEFSLLYFCLIVKIFRCTHTTPVCLLHQSLILSCAILQILNSHIYILHLIAKIFKCTIVSDLQISCKECNKMHIFLWKL